jgi:phosphoribosylanthranilate isomerase
MLVVKICGLTQAKDAALAQRLGAGITGFIFADSPRRITPEKAKRIIKTLKPGVLKAGVFVNEKISRVNLIIKKIKLDIAQLAGDESPAYLKQIKGALVFKAIRVKSAAGLKKDVKRYESSADAFLFDTYKKGSFGGTGKVFDWKMVEKAAVKKPFFIAGGLNPENVRAAIKSASPFGVDVSSGVEKSPGIKDERKMKKLFQEISKSKGKIKKYNLKF